MASHILIKFLGLIYKIYLTNKEGFGDKGNAICGSGFQIYALLLTISSIGIPNAISKLVSEKVAVGNYKGAHKTFKIAFALFSSVGFGCSLILYLFAKPIANIWLQIPEAEYTLMTLSPSIFFVTLISAIRGYFNGRENLKVTAKSQTIEQVTKIIFTILVVESFSIISGADTTIMAAGANLGTTFATIIGFIYLYFYYISSRKEIGNEIKIGNNKNIRVKDTIRSVLVVSLPMTITAFLGSMNKTIDSVTVVRGLKNFMTESNAKAEYGIIAGKIDTLIMLPMSFNIALITSLIPKISSWVAIGDIKRIKKLISSSVLLTLLIGIPCTFGMFFFASPILKLLFPNQNAGAFTLQISSISIVFIMLEQTINGILQGLGKHMLPTWALLSGAVVKLILNLLLVHLNSNYYIFGGINGAAFSTVVCHIVILFIEYLLLKKELKIKLNINFYTLFKIFCSVFIMIISSKYLYNTLLLNFSQNISLVISIAFAVFIYLLLIFLTRIINFREIVNKKLKTN